MSDRVIRNFINGESVDSADGQMMDLINPTTGEVFAQAAKSSAQDIDRAFAAASTAFDTWRLQRERNTLEAQRETIFRSAFPEAKVVVDPDLQMARNLAELKRARGLAGGDEFLVRMTAAARAAPGGVRSVEFANGKLTTR